ncbi:3637_t:CDS:2, partial [Dentiscutata erythropus]
AWLGKLLVWTPFHGPSNSGTFVYVGNGLPISVEKLVMYLPLPPTSLAWKITGLDAIPWPFQFRYFCSCW